MRCSSWLFLGRTEEASVLAARSEQVGTGVGDAEIAVQALVVQALNRPVVGMGLV